jgi:hypothetical protein
VLREMAARISGRALGRGAPLTKDETRILSWSDDSGLGQDRHQDHDRSKDHRSTLGFPSIALPRAAAAVRAKFTAMRRASRADWSNHAPAIGVEVEKEGQHEHDASLSGSAVAPRVRPSYAVFFRDAGYQNARFRTGATP